MKILIWVVCILIFSVTQSVLMYFGIHLGAIPAVLLALLTVWIPAPALCKLWEKHKRKKKAENPQKTPQIANRKEPQVSTLVSNNNPPAHNIAKPPKSTSPLPVLPQRKPTKNCIPRNILLYRICVCSLALLLLCSFVVFFCLYNAQKKTFEEKLDTETKSTYGVAFEKGRLQGYASGIMYQYNAQNNSDSSFVDSVCSFSIPDALHFSLGYHTALADHYKQSNSYPDLSELTEKTVAIRNKLAQLCDNVVNNYLYGNGYSYNKKLELVTGLEQSYSLGYMTALYHLNENNKAIIYANDNSLLSFYSDLFLDDHKMTMEEWKEKYSPNISPSINSQLYEIYSFYPDNAPTSASP